MANFIIAPTLTMGMRAPFEGVIIATKWPIGNSMGKIEKYSADSNNVYMVKSSEHDEYNLSAILETLENHSKVFTIKEVSL